MYQPRPSGGGASDANVAHLATNNSLQAAYDAGFRNFFVADVNAGDLTIPAATLAVALCFTGYGKECSRVGTITYQPGNTGAASIKISSDKTVNFDSINIGGGRAPDGVTGGSQDGVAADVSIMTAALFQIVSAGNVTIAGLGGGNGANGVNADPDSNASGGAAGNGGLGSALNSSVKYCTIAGFLTVSGGKGGDGAVGGGGDSGAAGGTGGTGGNGGGVTSTCMFSEVDGATSVQGGGAGAAGPAGVGGGSSGSDGATGGVNADLRNLLVIAGATTP